MIHPIGPGNRHRARCLGALSVVGATIGDMMRFEWRPFLERWSAEWADGKDAKNDAGDEREDGDREAREARWLGFEPAGEERILALEDRLGCPLPPSLRSFLQVTDGWRHAGDSIPLLAGTGGIDWCADPHGLRLASGPGGVDVLLDPYDVDERGEWAVHTYRSGRGAPHERHGSFKHFMEDMYEEFLGALEGVAAGSASAGR